MGLLKNKLIFMIIFFIIQIYSQESQNIIETKLGYFFFSDSKMRQVYNNGGIDIQLSSSIPIFKPKKNLIFNAYGSIEFLRCSGYSTKKNYKTYLWELPINIGIKPIFILSNKLQYYFSLGPRYFFIRQSNSSQYVDKNNSKNGIGFFINTGLNFIIIKNLVIDIFSEYSYTKTHFNSHNYNVYTRNIEIGGFTFGVGFGYLF